MDHSLDVKLNHPVTRPFALVPAVRSVLAAGFITILIGGLMTGSEFSLMSSAAAQDRAGAPSSNNKPGIGANRRDDGRGGARARGPAGRGATPNADDGANRGPSDGGAGRGCPYRNQQLDLIV